MTEHYFSPDPSSPARTRKVPLTLAGRPLTVTTAAGTFSPEGLDKGTAVLLNHAPQPPARGQFLDLGCGWGPIAMHLALTSPGAQVFGVDVNARALELARDNAMAADLVNVTFGEAAQVPDGARFDLIWSNPPIRIGKQALHELLLTWMPRLAPGGDAYLVVSKNLGADSLQRWMAGALDQREPGALTVQRHDSHRGFRILHVHRA